MGDQANISSPSYSRIGQASTHVMACHGKLETKKYFSNGPTLQRASPRTSSGVGVRSELEIGCSETSRRRCIIISIIIISLLADKGLHHPITNIGSCRFPASPSCKLHVGVETCTGTRTVPCITRVQVDSLELDGAVQYKCSRVTASPVTKRQRLRFISCPRA